GTLSSLFDVITFLALMGVFHAEVTTVRTGWFVESLLTELAVTMVLRTRRRCYRSKPGRALTWSTVAIAVIAFAIPYLPYARVLGFVPLALPLMATLIGITVLYVVSTELTKIWFFRQNPA